jgi:SNF2 family DNA or RNA helicase
VFIFDPWWNRAAEAQAVDRTHRIGQERPVFSYRIIAKDTIEEKILELQERKVGLVQSILSADVDMMKALTQEDIEFLLDAAPAGARTKGARI